MTITGIDPGPAQSAFVTLRDTGPTVFETLDNDAMICRLPMFGDGALAIEMVACYGMPVGREVFETCLWIGRFVEAWHRLTGRKAALIYRLDIKLGLCGSARAKDSNVRQALLDIYGPQGTKKTPGPTYGLKGHEWSALAVAHHARSRR